MPLVRPTIITAPAGPSLPFGILSVALQPPAGDPASWAEYGAHWRPTNCEAPLHATGSCALPAGASEIVPDLTGDDYPGPSEAYPFTVLGHDVCQPVGVSFEESQQRAERQLLTGEEHAIEEAIETGLSGGVLPNFTLAEDVTPTAGVAVPIVEGVAILEGLLGSVPGAGQGVIHMTRTAAIMGDSQGLELDQTSGRLTTLLKTPVVVGSGYRGRATLTTPDPDRTPGAGEQWIYATGMPSVIRSPLTPRGSDGTTLDRATNTRTVVVDRDVLVGWSCGTWAVLVDGLPDVQEG